MKLKYLKNKIENANYALEYAFIGGPFENPVEVNYHRDCYIDTTILEVKEFLKRTFNLTEVLVPKEYDQVSNFCYKEENINEELKQCIDYLDKEFKFITIFKSTEPIQTVAIPSIESFEIKY